MSNERERVTHPSWCDRDACTAPEFRPTNEQYKSGANLGQHASRELRLPGYKTLRVFLAQQIAPWQTATFLVMRSEDGEMSFSTEVGGGGAGFELYELLGQEVKDSVREYPTLYAERFPYVQRAIEDEADEATADASMPRDPVELEERMTAEFLADEETEQREAKGCTHPPDEPCFGKAPAVTDPDAPKIVYEFAGCVGFGPCENWDRCGPARKCWLGRPDAWVGVEDPSPGESQMRAKYPMSYRLTVNGKTDPPYATFEQVRAAVADIVTRRLGAEPVRVAAEAGALNAAFSSGEVLAALDDKADWYTVFDAYGELPLRIRITAERD